MQAKRLGPCPYLRTALTFSKIHQCRPSQNSSTKTTTTTTILDQARTQTHLPLRVIRVLPLSFRYLNFRFSLAVHHVSPMLISSPQRLQLENARLNAAVKKLKVRGASGQAVPDNAMAAISVTTSSTISGTTTTNQDTSLHRDYSSFGKRFAVLSELWVQRSILRQPNPLRFQSSGPWDPERCRSDAAWNEGIIAELYSLIPERFHEHIEHSPVFSTKVCRQSLQLTLGLNIPSL